MNETRDPVVMTSTLTALLATYVSPMLAHFLGMYLTIVMASVAGGAWALMSSESDRTRWQAMWFVLLLVVTAMSMTTGVAKLAAQFLGLAQYEALLGPVAFLVAAIGDRWPQVVRKITSLVLLRGGQDKKPGEGETQ